MAPGSARRRRRRGPLVRPVSISSAIREFVDGVGRRTGAGSGASRASCARRSADRSHASGPLRDADAGARPGRDSWTAKVLRRRHIRDEQIAVGRASGGARPPEDPPRVPCGSSAYSVRECPKFA